MVTKTNINEKQKDLSRRQFLSVAAAALASPMHAKIPLDQVRTKAEWEKLRAQTLANMQLVMGVLLDFRQSKGNNILDSPSFIW